MTESFNNTDIYKLKNLIEFLIKNHEPNYVYRGQNKRWIGPLVPSLYRGMLNKDQFTDFDYHSRLYEKGGIFHELSTGQNLTPRKDWTERYNTNGYLKQYFGYPLSQILSQQFSINSEGLDVTSDPMIAAFFAIFQSKGNTLNKNEPGIIYRFKLPKNDMDPNELISSDFYTVNNYLDGYSVLKSLGTCLTWEESLESFIEFGFKATMILTGIDSSTSRPFHLLKLPNGILNDSRIIRQKAGLIFPDMILSTFYRNIGKSAPLGKAEKKGTNAIEDMQFRDNIDIFNFEHSTENVDLLNIQPEFLFPKSDPLIILLKSFLTSFNAPGNVMYFTEGGTFSNFSSWELIQ
jgi:hypothetical protein